MNKITLITFFIFGFVCSYSQTNKYIVKKDTIYDRQIIEQHIYKSFVVQFDSLIDIYSVFQDSLTYLTSIAFIENDNVLLELNYSPYMSNEKNSVCINYSKNDKLISETYFLIEYLEKDSLKRNDGLYRAYYPTKEIKERGNFQKDIKTGKWLYYYDNGEIKSKGEYSGDYFLIRNIKYTTELFISKPNLDTLIENEYPQDLKEYMDTIFNGNTKLVFPQIFHRKIGEWLYYDNLGQLTRKEYFNDNGLYRREYYSEGKIIKEENY